MTRADHQVKIRLPDELRDRLTNVATQNGRSINAEIIWRLRRSFDPSNGGPPVFDGGEMLLLLRDIHAAVLGDEKQKA
jgi:hypothetical protein